MDLYNNRNDAWPAEVWSARLLFWVFVTLLTHGRAAHGPKTHSIRDTDTGMGLFSYVTVTHFVRVALCRSCPTWLAFSVNSCLKLSVFISWRFVRSRTDWRERERGNLFISWRLNPTFVKSWIERRELVICLFPEWSLIYIKKIKK